MTRVRVFRIVLAVLPIVALTICVPFVNHTEPRLFGMPFVLIWILAWVFATPAFLWGVGRTEGRW
ncbi:MAG: DUF3311 domain-containing protein [Vulcanimicrobiaceae bacterium]